VTIAPRFADFLLRLGGHGVDYLIVGGHALVFHGYEHPVPDLDLWIRPTRDAWLGVTECLATLGFRVTRPLGRVTARPGPGIGIGVPPERIDLLRWIGLDFATCFARRAEWATGTLRAPVLSLADLRRSKRVAGRPGDVDDLAALRRMRRSRQPRYGSPPNPGA